MTEANNKKPPAFFYAILPVFDNPLWNFTMQHQYMVLDPRNIESTKNVVLACGNPIKDKHNPLFGQDKPWEPRFDNADPNVIFDADEQLYKCWYSPFIISNPENTIPKHMRVNYNWREMALCPRENAVCYAFSVNGIDWVKPVLNSYDFKGSSSNNIVFRRRLGIPEDGVNGAGIFRDNHDTDPSRRYKMLFRNGKRNFGIAYSANGVNWDKCLTCETVDSAADTHNNAIWSDTLNRYVGFTRLWNNDDSAEAIRVVGRTESKNFENWSKAEPVLQGPDKNLQTYGLTVFEYNSLFLGFVTIYNLKTDRVHVVLARSIDTFTWDVIDWNHPFIPMGEEGSCDWGCIYPSAPVISNSDIRLYYCGSNNTHSNWREGTLCLAYLELEKFAGYEPSDKRKSGYILTAPVTGNISQIAITADASDGQVTAEIIGRNDYTFESCVPIKGHVKNKTIQWEHDSSVLCDHLPIQIRFKAENARIYSFSVMN